MIIFEFAKNRSDIKRELMDKTPRIVEHLIKLILSPDNDAKDHWIHEIYSFLHNIDISKSTKKWPKESFIYANTFGCLEDKYEIYNYVKIEVQSICELENVPVPKNIKNVQMDILLVGRQYFKWLSEKLSTYGAVAPSEIKKEIEYIMEGLLWH